MGRKTRTGTDGPLDEGRGLPGAVRRGPDGAVASCCNRVVPLPVGEHDAARWARIFQALGDPTRLSILALLSAQPGALCVCDIVAQFPRAQPTISHHLRVLREAGLVTADRRSQWMYYRVSPAGVMAAWRALARLVP